MHNCHNQMRLLNIMSAGTDAPSRAGKLWMIATNKKKHQNDVLYAQEELREILSNSANLTRESGYDLLKLMEASHQLSQPLERVSQVCKVLEELGTPRRKHLVNSQSLEYPKRILLVIEKLFRDGDLTGRGKVYDLRNQIIDRLAKECRKSTRTDLAIELFVKSPRFRAALEEPKFHLRNASDYHLTLIPVICGTGVLGPNYSISLFENALSELLFRKAVKQLSKF